MNIRDAAHLIAHEAPGGLEALAMRMGIGYKVFNAKCNPNDDQHVLGMIEALRMQQLTGRADILFAMADALDYICIKKPSVETTDLAHQIAITCAEFGDFLRQIDTTMKDGRVTRNELKKVQKELAEMIGAANTLQALIAAKAR